MKRFLPILILTGLLFGQSFGELILEKDGEQVTIPKGDWVVAVNSQDSDIFVGSGFGGSFVGENSTPALATTLASGVGVSAI